QRYVYGVFPLSDRSTFLPLSLSHCRIPYLKLEKVCRPVFTLPTSTDAPVIDKVLRAALQLTRGSTLTPDPRRYLSRQEAAKNKMADSSREKREEHPHTRLLCLSSFLLLFILCFLKVKLFLFLLSSFLSFFLLSRIGSHRRYGSSSAGLREIAKGGGLMSAGPPQLEINICK
ncbi:hypothetical protein ANANG_G00299900, partial [Anguilla anguilla]